MSALGDFLLAPGRTGRVRPVARARRASATLGVVAPAPALVPVACAAGVALARRARAPRSVVCLFTGTTPAPAPGPRPGSNALAASLAARDVPAHRRGRLLVAALPAEPGEAARAARLALAAAGDLPFVLAVAIRTASLDALLAAQDAVLVAAPAGDALAELAVASAAALAPRAGAIDMPGSLAARALARAGLVAPGCVRRSIDAVLA
ncbi:MAG: hypothetical protein ACXVFT_13100 [Solirubrobacteraceae bacterium]